MLAILVLVSSILTVNMAGLALAAPGEYTWTERDHDMGDFDAVASSADGTKLAALGDDTIYLSADSGVTWTEHSIDNYTSESIIMSADGTRIVALLHGGGAGENYLYVSTDFGTTWVKHQVPIYRPNFIAGSADTTRLLVAFSEPDFPDYVYTGVMEPFPPIQPPQQNPKQPLPPPSKEGLAETGLDGRLLISGGLASVVLGCILFRKIYD